MNLKKINYSWFIFIGCCMLSFVGFGLVVNTPGLYFIAIAQELNISKTEIAFTITAQQIVCAITLLFAGKILNKFHIKLILTICVLLFGGGFISSSFFHSIYPFYIVWGMMGMGQAFALLIVIPVLLGNWFSKKLGLVLGIAMSVTALGGALFNPLISYIITDFGWRNGYLAAGLISLITLLPFTLLVFRFEPNKSKGERPYGYEEYDDKNADNQSANLSKIALEAEHEGFTAKEAFCTSTFYLFIIPMILLNIVAGLIQHVPGHIVNLEFTLKMGAAVVSCMMIGAAIGKVGVGILLDLFNAKLVIIIYTIAGMVGWSGLVIFYAEIMLLGSGLLLGAGQALVLVAIPFFIRKKFGSKEYGHILSVISMFGALSQAASATLGGALFDLTGNYNIPIGLNVIAYAISCVCIILAISSKSQYQTTNNKTD